MEDQTMKLGLLMEAAQANQKLADASMRKLKAFSQELLDAMRDEVHRLLLQELQSLAGDSRRASEALRDVRRVANIRVGVWSLGLTLLCSAIPLGLTYWMIPSQAEITTLRARYNGLRSNVAALEERGGRIDLRRCGEGERLCVRIDRSAPAYGEKADYLVVKGY